MNNTTSRNKWEEYLRNISKSYQFADVGQVIEKRNKAINCLKQRNFTMALLQKLFGSNEREIGKLKPLVEKINAFEKDIHALSDEALQAKTAEFRERVAQGESLDALLPEAYAVVREAAHRVIGERH